MGLMLLRGRVNDKLKSIFYVDLRSDLGVSFPSKAANVMKKLQRCKSHNHRYCVLCNCYVLPVLSRACRMPRTMDEA